MDSERDRATRVRRRRRRSTPWRRRGGAEEEESTEGKETKDAERALGAEGSREEAFPQQHVTEIWEENTACILMSENPVARDRQRQVDVKFHFLRERMRLGELHLIKCHGHGPHAMCPMRLPRVFPVLSSIDIASSCEVHVRRFALFTPALSHPLPLPLPLIAHWSLTLSVAPRSTFLLAPSSLGVPSPVPAGANLLL